MTAHFTLENKEVNWEVDDIPVYGTANAKIGQVLDEAIKEMPPSSKNGLIQKSKTLIGKQPVNL